MVPVHLAPLLALSVALVVAGEPDAKSFVQNTVPTLSSCASELSGFSCENTVPIKNACCSPTPGGLVLATQFWSTYTGLEKKDQKLPKEVGLSTGSGQTTVTDLLNSTATCRGSTTPRLRQPNYPMVLLFQHTRVQGLIDSFDNLDERIFRPS